MEKLIITVGITGSRITRQQTPCTPITPEDVAQSGKEDWRAGASVLHILAKDHQIYVKSNEPGFNNRDDLCLELSFVKFHSLSKFFIELRQFTPSKEFILKLQEF